MNINQMSQVIKNFVTSTNNPDPMAYLNCFSEDAVVYDEGETMHGKDAIKKWSDEKQFAVNLRLEPREIEQDTDKITVTFKLDGNYDKAGLPDPLLLDFHFHIQNNKIVKLSIY